MRILFLCNTVYQIMVASWLKKTKYTDVSADVIISDHMNNYGNISDRVRECAFFDKVYKIKSKSYINAKEKISIRERLYRGLRPEKALSDIIKFKGKYDCLFIANLDRFSQSLYNVLKNYKHSKVGNKKLKLYIYEDGIMTYSKLFDKYYKNCIPEFYTWRLKLLNKYICNNQYIFKNVSSMYLFNPDLICYLPDCKIEQIDKIDINDKKFIEYLNYVFSYDSSKDIYDKPIIFIEESIYIDSEQRPDLELFAYIV